MSNSNEGGDNKDRIQIENTSSSQDLVIGSLYGNVNVFWLDAPFYYCERGPHFVAMGDVEKRDAPGDAICRLHSGAMSMVEPKEMQAALEQVRSELSKVSSDEETLNEEKMSDENVSFVREMISWLDQRHDTQLAHFCKMHPVVFIKRLLQILKQGPLTK